MPAAGGARVSRDFSQIKSVLATDCSKPNPEFQKIPLLTRP